eukprot:GDKJ01032222.1.p3 GENE.GDKJ01032222.1~~GDKJ01032222.1.p3  ORF type:complete len:106 (+),score=5.87 GDKJ01032222.1:1749-2066(+)
MANQVWHMTTRSTRYWTYSNRNQSDYNRILKQSTFGQYPQRNKTKSTQHQSPLSLSFRYTSQNYSEVFSNYFFIYQHQEDELLFVLMKQTRHHGTTTSFHCRYCN